MPLGRARWWSTHLPGSSQQYELSHLWSILNLATQLAVNGVLAKLVVVRPNRAALSLLPEIFPSDVTVTIWLTSATATTATCFARRNKLLTPFFTA